MAIKRTAYRHTGMFETKVTHVELRTNEESLQDLATVFQSAGFGRKLGQIESVARHFLNDFVKTDILNRLSDDERRKIKRVKRTAGIEWLVMRHVDWERERLSHELAKKLTTEKERELIRALSRVERAADANDILCLIPGLRLSMEAGQPGQISAEQIAAEGFALGDACGRFKAREFERAAYTGAKVLEGASGGGSNAEKKNLATEQYLGIALDFQKSGLSRAVFSRMRNVSPSRLQRALTRAKKVRSHPAK